jgi:hypothetical protein
MAMNLSKFIVESAVNEYRVVRAPSFFIMYVRIQLGCPDISFASTAMNRGVKLAPFKRSTADWIKTVKLHVFCFRIRDFQIVITATALSITVETKNMLRNTSAIASTTKLVIVGNLMITFISSLKIKQVLPNMLSVVVEFISANKVPIYA